MVYWADIRYPEPLPSPEAQRLLEEGLPFDVVPSSIEDVALSAGPGESEADCFEAALLAGYAAWATDYRDEALAEYGPEVLGPIGDFLLPHILRRWAKDARAYFYEADRVPVQERLRDALRSVDGPVVVMGHSLGGIFSYDVLSEDAFSRLDPVSFVTFGCRLGAAEIQNRVAQPLTSPAAAQHWRNFFDGGDYPASQPLAGDFGGVTITDVRVNNRARWSHSAGGYLSTPQMRNYIQNLLND